jgi:hypothetical protein
VGHRGHPGSVTVLAATSMLAVLLGAPRVRAEAAWQARAALTVDARGEVGTGSVEGLDLGALGVGVEWWMTPTLRLRTMALLLGGTGSTDSGQSANGGAGGELALRLIPFPAWPVRPYGRLSGGFLLFLRGPFLPGGDFYDFILTGGAGLEVPLGPRVALFGDLHATHLSNGQGIGPFNPSFNGWGGLAGVTYALASERPAECPPPPETPNRRAGWTPGAIVEGWAGWGTAFIAGGRLRVAERLAWRLLAMLDTQWASYEGVAYEDVGLALVGHWSRATAGAQVSYEHIPGIDAIAEQAQLEGHLTREVSLLATGILQQQRLFDDFVVGAFGVRAFPVDWLRIEGGVKLTRAFSAGATTEAGPFVGVEGQVPLGAPDWQLSAFVEQELATGKIAGLRLAWNMGASLRDVARRTGWVRLR